MGLLYHSSGEYKKALNVFNKSLRIFESIDEKSNICSTLNFIGRSHFEVGELETSEQHHQLALSIAKEIKNEQAFFGSSHSLVNVLVEMNRDLDEVKLENVPKKSNRRASSLYENIVLLKLCNQTDVTLEGINSQITHVIETKNNFETNEVSDMPVQALLQASRKLIEFGEVDEAINYSNKALDFIGERKTIMKKELENLVKHYTTKTKQH